jgi:orotidine-5'-phosphate decarboxylase
LDTDSLGPAVALARRLAGAAGVFKIGSQLFTAEGPHAVDQLAKLGSGIFLDLKFHDIPNTVAGAVRAAADLPQVRILTIHALGGLQMMKAAKEASRARRRSPAILAVTILTSHDASTLQQVGSSGTPGTRALELAKLAKEAGVDGVVASAHEVADIRKACGPKFLIIVPGVRPANAALNDQSRIATPAEAIRAGADYLVVGRPITAATNPRESALAIAKEIAQANSKPRA